MAKKAVKKTSLKKRRARSSSRSHALSADHDYKDLLKGFIANPAVRYVAGGIATAVLARIATNLSDRYPEISNFIKENLEGMEDKLSDFKSGLGIEESARH